MKPALLTEHVDSRRTGRVKHDEGGQVSVITPRASAHLPRGDRVLAALLGNRVRTWDDDITNVEPAVQRNRTRERIRAVHNLRARRRLRRLGVLGGRWLP